MADEFPFPNQNVVTLAPNPILVMIKLALASEHLL
jgi:hypothetical protein